jgi:hypothetical protein
MISGKRTALVIVASSLVTLAALLVCARVLLSARVVNGYLAEYELEGRWVSATVEAPGEITLELHTMWNVNPPGLGVPFNSDGVVGVTATDKSVTFTVIEEGYFDAAGSTISFSTWTDDNGQTYLRQTAYAFAGNPLIAFTINTFDAEQPTWRAQSENLAREIDKTLGG